MAATSPCVRCVVGSPEKFDDARAELWRAGVPDAEGGRMSMRDTTHYTPRQHGAAAYCEGKSIDQDPYRGIFGPWYGTDSQESADWRAGYMDAGEAHGAQIEARILREARQRTPAPCHCVTCQVFRALGKDYVPGGR